MITSLVLGGLLALSGGIPNVPEGPGRIYLGGADGRSHVYSVRPDGTKLKRLTPLKTNDQEPLASPDGSMVAFLRYERDEGYELMVMEKDGDKIREVSGDMPVSDGFSWSPNSRYLAFSARPPGSENDHGLWMVSIHDREPLLLADDAESEREPAWSPYGDEVAFARAGDLVVVNVETGDERILVEGAGEIYHPAWSPDGSEIAFVTTKDDPWIDPQCCGPYTSEVYVVPAEGGEPINVSLRERSWDDRPQWTPDSQRIVFESRYDSDVAWGRKWDTEIISVRRDGSGKVAVTSNKGLNDLRPVISPSGRHVAFVRTVWNGGGSRGLFKVRIDGNGLRQIVAPERLEPWPGSWGPGR